MKNPLIVIIVPFAVLISICSCQKYFDSKKYPPLDVYKTGYIPGEHKNLIFNGFYYYNMDPRLRYIINQDTVTFIKPVHPLFLFSDGSVCEPHNIIEMDQLINEKHKLEALGSSWYKNSTWGNYMINGDTIIMEFLHYSEGFIMHYDRVTKKGIIYKDSILKFEMKGANYLPKGCENDYTLRTYHFTEFDLKPDSTENWIRTEEYYN